MSSEAVPDPPVFDVAVQRRRGTPRDGVSVGAAFRAGPGVTVLFGRSGAGKTSVLDMVAGLLRPDRGYVRVGGRTLFDERAGVDVAPHHRRAGYVFQDARLFPNRRVRANLLYGAPDDRELARVAEMLDIAHLLRRWPGGLSGGEAKRVAIGRALLARPAFLLLDEPLASLDAGRAEGVIRGLERCRDELHLPILLVTHDPAEADRLGNRIVRM